MSSCLRMPVAPGTSSSLAILVSAPTLMSLSVESSIFSGGGGGGRPAVGARRLRLRGCGLRLLSSLSISFHSSSSPSPVTAETGSTGSSNTDSSALQRADPFAARELVDLRRDHAPRVRRSRCSQCQAARSLSRPGCRASTSSSAPAIGGHGSADRSAVPRRSTAALSVSNSPRRVTRRRARIRIPADRRDRTARAPPRATR